MIVAVLVALILMFALFMAIRDYKTGFFGDFLKVTILALALLLAIAVFAASRLHS